ncbi:MAG: FAD-dependent oxidoreductase [Firmicutes bacterium]|nr:FAD-dependent oxidoreductase [Bacillota bacterium]
MELKDNLDVFGSKHEPYWLSTIERDDYPSLEENLNIDVAIVGGGITGITSAFLLKKAGLKVAVLESTKLFNGTTGHTTAKLTSQHGLIYDRLLNHFGEEKARQYAVANEDAIRFVTELVKEKNIDCDFDILPAYIYTLDEKYLDKIKREVLAANFFGIEASFEENIPLPFKITGAIKFANQAKFHPLKYLLALAKSIPGDGSFIFENTKVVDIEDEEKKPIVVTKDGKKVTASFVIIASHFPFYDGFGLYFTKIHTQRSYAIAVKAKEKLGEGMFLNAETPTRSLRSLTDENGEELILVVGENHKTADQKNTKVHYQNLADFAKSNFTLESILYRWSTQDCMSVDGVPYIGFLTSKNPYILVATGFNKWGMTNSTAAAKIMLDLITKGESPWADIFSPQRFSIFASAPNLVVQNLDVFRKLISGKLTAGSKEEDLKNGEAKVITAEGQKVGAYRDNDGKLYLVDITCTHLGCELVWNDAELTWDCPCHGSRFSYTGENIEGPAFNRLKRLDKEDANVIDPNLV